jgi:hypothetical protein
MHAFGFALSTVSPISLRIKLMHSFVRQGANHSHSRSYGEDLQRNMADEGASVITK